MEYERFAALVAPHTGAMARMAAALVGLADAEDAAQEALVRAWNGWASLREEYAVSTWLLRITVNVCRNWQDGRFGTRQRLTAPLASLFDPLSDALVPLGIATPDAFEPAAFDLRSAVANLPPDLRQVVALRFYAGMDSTEIGAVLNIPAGTVRTRLQRALTRLREALADETNEHPQSTGEAHERGTIHG
jgi:RNA polymerase sigma-70 factor (ECF subfamily)